MQAEKGSLYGIKQSPRAWFGRFAKVMKESEYKQSQDDHTLFIKHSAGRGVTALLAYVDDIIVTGNDEREKHEVKQRLATEFEIKELGKLNSSVLRWHIPHKGSSSIKKSM